MSNQSRFATASLDAIRKYSIPLLYMLFPERIITTFFGLGYLPDWQNHWAAFFSIILAALVIQFTIGVTSSVISLTQASFIIAFILLFIGILSIYIFQKNNRYSRYEITIHVAFGQIMMIALSIPAIIKFIDKIFAFNLATCTEFLFCANWFFYIATYFTGMLVPYFIFRIVDILKPWPSYILDRDYDNCFSYISEGLFNAIYASLLIYLLAFLLLDLNIMVVINLYSSLLD